MLGLGDKLFVALVIILIISIAFLLADLSKQKDYKIVCVEGVEYVIFQHEVQVLQDSHGNVKGCLK